MEIDSERSIAHLDPNEYIVGTGGQIGPAKSEGIIIRVQVYPENNLMLLQAGAQKIQVEGKQIDDLYRIVKTAQN
ncbi:MAG: hypothetical protein UY21_C0007G0017 [Microgenomates group bacterium GW2011_GWA1_48_10]|uniref:Uncharacterized protein n=1 Tax=Candidatus Gottesmanbacteria bacterium RIFCSPHIGHO2_01_FULL_47_48 TaxID=1798381 RepID=A0A1F6A2S0_9BACT|nr:MAG: hypothetical protein UY21_C0007G0017 [Microgenomates group bacterium GW2011_GWA1_48_10]OGG18963.1 MAG: hypothetical protein A2721_02380 [Candidatus Gottesmanbacteria bacterium RIFCSPHIGHO2_01_FULL_47_48]